MAKNELEPQTPHQVDTYHVKGSDFPVSNVAAATGQSGAHGTAEGANALAAQSENQCGPRHIEDGGPGSKGSGTPTTWESGGRSAKVSSAFPIKKNSGESESGGTSSVGASESVNLSTGLVEAKGYSSTRVKETPEKKVSIPSGR